jgi:hypothetical protein
LDKAVHNVAREHGVVSSTYFCPRGGLLEMVLVPGLNSGNVAAYLLSEQDFFYFFIFLILPF